MTGARARCVLLAGTFLLAPLLSGALAAQEPAEEVRRPPPPPPPPAYDQMVSLNPFGLLLEFYNLEFERPVSDASTIGVGGALYQGSRLVNEGSDTEDEYANFDVFWRFYPGGRPMDGWAFGAKVGLTRIDGGTRSGFGFDVNRSWLLGANQNFYVGVGVGLKRLLGDTLETRFIPTFRIVNLGFAF